MKRFLKTVAVVVAAILLIAAIVGGYLYHATQQVPEFYVQALELKPQEQQEAGQQLEKNLLDLRNDARDSGQWSAEFTDAQINGWLAFDLPVKFGDLLPAEFKEPRVSISPTMARVACRYEGKIKTILSLALDLELTSEPNVMAIRVRNVRAGALGLPLKKVLDEISAAAKKSGLRLRWKQKSGAPVALLTLPLESEESTKHLQLETLRLGKGKVYVSGHTVARPTLARVTQGSSP